MTAMTATTATAIVPTNAATGRYYQGGNAARLAEACALNGWTCGTFATFRQWLALGRCVRKGEKAQAFVVRIATESVEVHDKQGNKSKVERSRPCGGSAVFHISQTDGDEYKGPIEGTADDKPVSSLRLVDKPRTAPAPTPTINADKLRSIADSLQAKAEACNAPRQENTPKRLAQAMHKRLEGDRLGRQASMLRNMAEHGIPDAMKAKKLSELRSIVYDASLQTTQPCRNGYHSYSVETGTWTHTSQECEAARTMLGNVQSTTKQAQALAELRSVDIEGFFPTPPSVVQVMLECAGSLEGKTVLEPSCGKGDLVQAALDAGAESVLAYEVVPRLWDYCKKHVHSGTVCADFLSTTVLPSELVEVVLMNPPFERDAAPLHVLHALSWLAPQGRLVAVLPSNWSTKRNGEKLIAAMIGMSWHEVEVESGAFNAAESFRKTCVSTTLLVVQK